MKKYDQIHESVLKDVIDIYNDISSLSDENLLSMFKKHKNGGPIKSIARASNDLICVFPVLSSRNISIDSQAMVAKAIEKNCVSMLQMLFSANQLTSAEQAADYIKYFHTNINKSAKAIDLDDVIQLADMIGINDSAIQVGGKVDYAIVEQVRNDMRNLNFYMENNISDKSIAEGFSCNLDPDGKYFVTVETRQLLREADEDDENGGVDFEAIYDRNTNGSSSVVDTLANHNVILHNELINQQNINSNYRKTVEYQKRTIDAQNLDIEKLRNNFNNANNEVKALRSERNKIKGETERGLRAKDSEIKTLERRLAKAEKDAEAAKKDLATAEKKAESRRMRVQNRKDSADFYSKQVLNTEYKKANELMPTLMVVNFKAKVEGEVVDIDSVVIGVKAKLYPMSSEDIITHVVAKAKDANWVQKFIKASTREISFFKDFLFAIDKAKIDALSLSRKGSANKMWKVLERRAAKSKWNRLMAKATNDSTAITTLMMSQSEIDYIKKEFHIDIADAYNSRILLESYNLLGICIVDESLEIAKFMWDTGEDMWETTAFGNLERESNDNTYKKVVNLMTKHM